MDLILFRACVERERACPAHSKSDESVSDMRGRTDTSVILILLSSVHRPIAKGTYMFRRLDRAAPCGI